MKKLLLILMITSTLGCSSTQTPTTDCKEDSLNYVIQDLTIQNGRYEIIIDRIRQVDSAIVDSANI